MAEVVRIPNKKKENAVNIFQRNTEALSDLNSPILPIKLTEVRECGGRNDKSTGEDDKGQYSGRRDRREEIRTQHTRIPRLLLSPVISGPSRSLPACLPVSKRLDRHGP